MPVVSNGKLIYSVLKYNDGGSSRFSLYGKLRFESGRGEGAIFEHNGIKLGVEICADAGSLRRRVYEAVNKDERIQNSSISHYYKLFTDEEIRNKYKPDIQVLSSCGADSTEFIAKKGGYILCSNGYSGKSEVYSRSYTKDQWVSESEGNEIPICLEAPRASLFVYELPGLKKSMKLKSRDKRPFTNKYDLDGRVCV
jgi:hypothetical protein